MNYDANNSDAASDRSETPVGGYTESVMYVIPLNSNVTVDGGNPNRRDFGRGLNCESTDTSSSTPSPPPLPPRSVPMSAHSVAAADSSTGFPDFKVKAEFAEFENTDSYDSTEEETEAANGPSQYGQMRKYFN